MIQSILNSLQKISAEVEAIKAQLQTAIEPMAVVEPVAEAAVVEPVEPMAEAAVVEPMAEAVDLPSIIARLSSQFPFDLWPKSVSDEVICDLDNEEDKLERASGIFSVYYPIMIWTPPGAPARKLTEHKLLDFGCGEGHLAKYSASQNIFSVGYDLLAKEETGNLYAITSNFENVKKSGPYDYVVLFDVLDHTPDPVDLLRQVRDVSHAGTRIFIRCHPWLSRHGGHLYHHINKAFIHLFLTDEELSSLTAPANHCYAKTTPFPDYGAWVRAAGLNIVETIEDTSGIETFFVENNIPGIERFSPTNFVDMKVTL